MSDHEQHAGQSSVMCSFCAEELVSDDHIASIRLLSHARGVRYFGVHVRCLQQVVHPTLAQQFELADIPIGMDHFLALPG